MWKSIRFVQEAIEGGRGLTMKLLERRRENKEELSPTELGTRPSRLLSMRLRYLSLLVNNEGGRGPSSLFLAPTRRWRLGREREGGREPVNRL